jgi:hypothetical protein
MGPKDASASPSNSSEGPMDPWVVFRTVRIVPQARARNVERLGRYSRSISKAFTDTLPRSPAVRDTTTTDELSSRAADDAARAAEAAAEAVADASKADGTQLTAPSTEEGGTRALA